jgi:hypothetical protein
MAEGLNIEITSHDDDSELLASIYEMPQAYCILANAWALGGCYDITYEKKTAKYVAWPDVCQYIRNNERDVMEHIRDYTRRSSATTSWRLSRGSGSRRSLS